MQQESAISSFLESLHNAGVNIPQDIYLLDSSDRVRFREPTVSQGRVWHAGSASVQTRLAPGARVSSASLPEGVDLAWLDVGVNEGASSSSAAPAGRSALVEPSPRSFPADPAVCSAPVEPTARSVSFAELVFHSVDDDAASVSSEKPLQEGLRSILWLLYQLCPSAASESLTSSDQKTCEFESLFATEVKLRSDELPPVLFHRVAELWSQAQLHYQSIAESGRLPSTALPARKRLAASCAEERLHNAAPFNTNRPRLVGSLSDRRSLNLSFDEAAKVESLLKGIWIPNGGFGKQGHQMAVA